MGRKRQLIFICDMLQRLSEEINIRNEKLKEEMIGKTTCMTIHYYYHIPAYYYYFLQYVDQHN